MKGKNKRGNLISEKIVSSFLCWLQVAILLRGDDLVLESEKECSRRSPLRIYSEKLQNAQEYNSTSYLSDLSQHKQVALGSWELRTSYSNTVIMLLVATCKCRNNVQKLKDRLPTVSWSLRKWDMIMLVSSEGYTFKVRNYKCWLKNQQANFFTFINMLI